VNKRIDSRIVELTGPRELVVKQKSLDLIRLKENEVAAETIFSAISPGTEVAAYRGDPPLRPMNIYPRVVGYCNVAEVVACGDKVGNYKVGDRILSFESHRSAFICPAEKIITRIPMEADLVEVSTTYLFHLGYNALLKGDVKPGHNVAVIGLGTLGLTTVATANLFGANVYAFSNQKSSHELAMELGACSAFYKEEGSVCRIMDQETRSTGIDVVVTTSNSWKDWRLALRLPRKGGKICVVGFPGRTQPIPDFNPLDSQYFYDYQLSLIACGYTPDNELPPHEMRFTIKRNCEFLLDCILAKRLPARKIITSVVKWDKIEEVYQAMMARKDPIVTRVLQWK
jgi:threonine dehydrogenase-like Zn-dependent dehydrogenase